MNPFGMHHTDSVYSAHRYAARMVTSISPTRARLAWRSVESRLLPLARGGMSTGSARSITAWSTTRLVRTAWCLNLA